MSRALTSRKKVTTVWLEGDYTSHGNDRVRIFTCFNCGKHVIKYRGNVIQVVPGDHPYTPATETKCTGNIRNEDGVWEECGQYYSFMGTATPKPNRVE